MQLAKRDEKELRLLLFAELFPEPKPGRNVSHGIIANVKLAYSIPATVDQDVLIERLEQMGDLFPEVDPFAVVTWKPQVSEAAFLALPDAARQMLVGFVSIRPGMPTLKPENARDEDDE